MSSLYHPEPAPQAWHNETFTQEAKSALLGNPLIVLGSRNVPRSTGWIVGHSETIPAPYGSSSDVGRSLGREVGFPEIGPLPSFLTEVEARTSFAVFLFPS